MSTGEEAEQETSTLTFRVAAGEAGARLDAYLAARIQDWSRARIQRLIEDGDVLVGGRTAKPSYKLRDDDEIEVELTPSTPTEFVPENIPLDIIHEDDDLVVVNKPAGLVVHPAAGISSGTLANALAYRFRIGDVGSRNEKGSANPQSAFRNPQYPRPGIVHRLDRDTSGLIVVAKTESAHEKLSDQFRAREVFKSYVALVHGRVAQETGRIEGAIARDPRNRTRMAVVAGGRPALSLYRVRQRFDRFTLLDVEIKTGRTHQIRVHLQWLKHPVVGDAVYGEGRDNTVADPRLRARINAMGRQFLHAEQLGFHHPRTGEALRFTAALPPELGKILDELEAR
ncbi:MAG TPA: RluA family pseudouridine synthase [Pyrinomonadaceae bacterium]|nr:RluA family pseudouridine synthase [Pyrinomonadaceae bacterium]